MGEERDGMTSPWERDDWLPEHVGPFPIVRRQAVAPDRVGSVGPVGSPRRDRDVAASAVAARAEDMTAAAPFPPTPPPTARRSGAPWRRVVAGGAVVAVVAAAAVLVIADDGNRSGDIQRTAPGTTLDTAERTTDDAGTALVVGDAPEAVDDGGGPRDQAVGDTDVLAAAGLGLMVAVEPPTGVAAATIGERPNWTRWTIALPEPLSTAAVGTELVVLAGSDLHRIEVPSGRTRTLRIEAAGPGSHLAITDGAIAVTTYSQVVIVRDDRPVTSVSIAGAIVGIDPRPTRAEFLVTARPDERDVFVHHVVAADGASPSTEIDLVGSASPWERWILPTGEIARNEPGGVYAISDGGTAERIAVGRLLAVGRNHLLRVGCDESATCVTTLDDMRTGEVRDVDLTGLDPYLYTDTTMRISPDGRRIVFADWQRPVAVWRVLDTATGMLDDLDQLDDLRHTDTWMTDGTGLFSIDAQQLTYHPIVGPSVTIIGLGPIRAVVTAPHVPGSGTTGGDVATTL